MAETITVQVFYACPPAQDLRALRVPQGATLQQALIQSGILENFPEIDLHRHPVGIYGKLKQLDTVLRQHDRIEIYRPLIAEARDARRHRAQKAGQSMTE